MTLSGTFSSLGVLGGGAWGSALAQTLCLAGRKVCLWAREPEVAAEINALHTNGAFLPGVTLEADLQATTDLALVARQDAVLMVAPAQHVRAVAGALAQHLPAGKPVLLCATGLEQATGFGRRSRTHAKPCYRGRASPSTWRAGCPRPSRSPPPTWV